MSCFIRPQMLETSMALKLFAEKVLALRCINWIDRDGKTPLVVTCMNPELIDVAKTLIELGANVNAYRPGRNAGTPLHHAAKRGLEQTVKLLLSHGANALLRNDDCHTPLEVARIKGFTNVVRAIENHICYFSGWLREFRGPGFLGGFAPQLLSRKIWAVIVPCGSGNSMKPSRFELAIYSTLQDAQPQTVIALWKAKIEEPKFHKSDPSLAIFDQSTKTRYKLASGNEGDKQQLQWLYSACKGILQVIPSPMVLDTQTSSAATAAESAELNNNHSSGAVDANGWENPANVESYNGWGPATGQAHSESSNTGWMDGPTRKDYNGWGVPGFRSTGNQSHHVQTLGDHSGWMDTPTKKDNDWAVPDSRPTGKQSHHVENLMDPPPLVQTSGFNASMSSAPSAPPIPEDVLGEEPIHYPSIDLNPVDIPAPTTTGYGAFPTNDAKDGGSSSCIICWEAPIEGACIPCGHMAGCMSCLNEIKAKNGFCPVCRGKIDQVIRLYSV
ncbi:putative E3 ubiquitin-protein ligase XBAT35 isoform X3 [Durio zibethinus]|uniref:E3 ubiquitin-protein ligase XBAT35 isoform X3 n=1 Tax=Durio zibethinus TaxID=66656 RepID=A0A6P6A0B1_DURZI|nr:putative E3 ubiquitin-protein ligase XBAT35 isoform X3 [Durio zibethinus]